MAAPHTRMPWPTSLGLRRGEVVEVRSRGEILATLDGEGRLERMPFMPEMLQFCGKRFRVSGRAEKSCDTVMGEGARRVPDAVHLEGVRCDGSAHGGCQALCLVWWKEAWLRRLDGDEAVGAAAESASVPPPRCTEEDLHAATQLKGLVGDIYSCQATRLLDFSRGLRWWYPGPVLREIRCGNVSVGQAVRVLARSARNMLRRKLGKPPDPSVRGRCEPGETPSGTLPGLKPGDWVVVKSQEEIEATLDRHQKNRGLFFDVEMLPYCGHRMKVVQKVDRIIDERTGAMRRLPNDCWILEGGVCSGFLSRNRLFCTRQIYSFWREIWLERADGPPEDADHPPDPRALPVL